MRIEGRVFKSGKFWAVEVPLLVLFTQGRTRKDAYLMVKDAVEELVDRASFKASVTPAGDDQFIVGANDEKLLFSTALRQRRASKGLTVRELAKRLGSRSPTAYARYETGVVNISFEKFTEIMNAIDGDSEPVVTVLRKQA